MTYESKIQVNKEHYFHEYDTPERFLHYFYQIESVLKTNPSSVLEVGIGNKTVYDCLKRHQIVATSLDIDPALQPDVVGDICASPFESETFDTVLACEVLEHLPFEESVRAIDELHRVARRYVIISLPYTTFHAALLFRFRVPRFQQFFRLGVRIPYFFIPTRMNARNKEHFWELGRKGYSRRKIRRILEKKFVIEKAWQPKFLFDHYFYILRKK